MRIYFSWDGDDSNPITPDEIKEYLRDKYKIQIGKNEANERIIVIKSRYKDKDKCAEYAYE